MAQISRVLRIARVLAASAILLLFVLFVGIQIRQHLLRHRVEQLFSDIRDIHPHKSNWQDAQALMKRWGPAGRAETSCSPESCVYQITVGNMRGNFRLLQRLGMRDAWVRFRFLVHANIVEQTSTEFWLEVPGGALRSGPDYKDRYVLIFTEKNFPSLRVTHYLGVEEQLGDHPFYIVTRPGGCSDCLKADVQYSTDISQSDLNKLTAFNLGCITSFRPCVWLEDVLPAAEQWQLYGYPWAPLAPDHHFTLKPCRVPIWALGRDTRTAIIGDTISTVQQKLEDGNYYEGVSLRVVSSIPNSKWRSGNHLTVLPYPEEPAMSEHLIPGKRYIVLLDDWNASATYVGIRRCGVLDDTPQTRLELNKGFIQRNSYKGPLLGNAP